MFRRALLPMALASLPLMACDKTIIVNTELPVLPIPDTLAEHFLPEAYLVAFEMHYQYPQFREHQIEIPKVDVYRIGNAMEAVWRSESLERDTVFDYYGITAWPQIDLQEFRVSEQFTQPEVVRLLEEYGFKVVPDRFKYRSNNRVNTVALLKYIQRIERNRFPRYYTSVKGGSGDRIAASILKDRVRLDYTKRWGDCMLGCIHGRTYRFDVYNAGTVVNFPGTGDPPCEPGKSCW
jgi:hypothetical protein